MRLQDEGEAGASGGRSPRGDRSSSPRTAAGDSGRPRSAPAQGDRQGGNRATALSGDRRGAPGDRRGGGPGAGGDSRGAGNSGDRRAGGNAQAAPANGAMADALRRAGLVNDKGTQSGKDRRSNRP
jgi:uncharacterized protein